MQLYVGYVSANIGSNRYHQPDAISKRIDNCRFYHIFLGFARYVEIHEMMFCGIQQIHH